MNPIFKTGLNGSRPPGEASECGAGLAWPGPGWRAIRQPLTQLVKCVVPVALPSPCATGHTHNDHVGCCGTKNPRGPFLGDPQVGLNQCTRRCWGRRLNRCNDDKAQPPTVVQPQSVQKNEPYKPFNSHAMPRQEVKPGNTLKARRGKSTVLRGQSCLAVAFDSCNSKQANKKWGKKVQTQKLKV